MYCWGSSACTYLSGHYGYGGWWACPAPSPAPVNKPVSPCSSVLLDAVHGHSCVPLPGQGHGVTLSHSPLITATPSATPLHWHHRSYLANSHVSRGCEAVRQLCRTGVVGLAQGPPHKIINTRENKNNPGPPGLVILCYQHHRYLVC